MTSPDALPVQVFVSAEAWRHWLDENHRDPGGLWLKIAKKRSGIESVTHDEALEVALCFAGAPERAAVIEQ